MDWRSWNNLYFWHCVHFGHFRHVRLWHWRVWKNKAMLLRNWYFSLCIILALRRKLNWLLLLGRSDFGSWALKGRFGRNGFWEPWFFLEVCDLLLHYFHVSSSDRFRRSSWREWINGYFLLCCIKERFEKFRVVSLNFFLKRLFVWFTPNDHTIVVEIAMDWRLGTLTHPIQVIL